MSYADMSLNRLLDELALGTPTPGGGSVAALCGAAAAALCAMVARVTHGKEKYRSAWKEMETIMAQGDDLRQKFLDLMNADAAAYQKVVEALRKPKNDEEEKAARNQALAFANRSATEVPLKTAQLTVEAGKWLDSLVEKGNPNCISDVGTAAQLLKAAAHSAAYNVRFNLGGIDDPQFDGACRRQLNQAVEKIGELVELIENKIADRLEGH